MLSTFAFAFLNCNHNLFFIAIIARYLHLSTAGITFFPNIKLRGVILIRFGIKHKENNLVALYDNWWLVTHIPHVSKSYCIPDELSAINHKSSALHKWLVRLSPGELHIPEGH